MAENRGQKAQARPGFTLIELLVVISVISILMSMLLPGLSAAREQGRNIHCRNNLKNLTYAWMMYATEYDDKLVSADTDWDVPPANHWVADGPVLPDNSQGGTEQALKRGVLWNYVGGNPEAYKCRSDGSDLLRSYAIARTMNGKTCNCEHDNIKPFRTLTEIEVAGNKMVFVDAASRAKWIEGSFCPVKDVSAVPPSWFRRCSRNITARHHGGCNLSFADGHCEYFKYKDERTVDYASWMSSSKKASEGNVDLVRFVELLKGKDQ